MFYHHSLITQLSEYPIMMVVRVASFLLVLAVATCQASSFLAKFFYIPRPSYAGEPHGTYSRSGPTYSSTSPAWPSPSSPSSLRYSTTTTSQSYSTTTPTPSPSSPSYSPTNPSLSTEDLKYLKYLKYLEYLKYLKY